MGTSADGCRDGYETTNARTRKRGVVIVVPEYRGHRIEVNAVEADGRWDAEVRIRQHAVHAKPRVRIVNCCELTAEDAERAGEIWARRWVDAKGGA
jgi:hypothetical protein